MAFGDGAVATHLTPKFAESVEAEQLRALLDAIGNEKGSVASDLNLVRTASLSDSKEGAIESLSKGRRWLLARAQALSLPLAEELIREALLVHRESIGRGGA